MAKVLKYKTWFSYKRQTKSHDALKKIRENLQIVKYPKKGHEKLFFGIHPRRDITDIDIIQAGILVIIFLSNLCVCIRINEKSSFYFMIIYGNYFYQF